jgi:nucleotide-binding universal stress UspA family protein
MFKKLVAAVDGSSCSAHALEVALRLAEAEGSRIAICSIVDPVSTSAPAGHAAEMAANAKRHAQQIVDKALARAKLAGVTAEGTTLLGEPAEEIVAYAKEAHADAVVVGTHGRSGFKRFFLGSVAESVLRSASIPVVIVRDEARIGFANTSAAS